jgi:hypothetical protein
MRNDRRGETFHELRQAQQQAREHRPKSKRGVPPIAARLFRIALVCLFGLLVLWLLDQADVPPLFRTLALAAVGVIVIVDVLRLLFD